jgi:hypothetical protein
MADVRPQAKGAGGPAGADPAGPSPADAGPAAAPARTLPTPTPGPTIARQAKAGLEPRRDVLGRIIGGGRGRKLGGKNKGPMKPRDRSGGRSAPATSPSAAPAASAPGANRELAAKIRTNHDRAARWLKNPDLAITQAEAQDVADALGTVGELTGWKPTGPLWDWLGVLTVLGGVYGGKVLALIERRQAEAAAAAAAGRGPQGPAPMPRPITPGPTISPHSAPAGAARPAPAAQAPPIEAAPGARNGNHAHQAAGLSMILPELAPAPPGSTPERGLSTQFERDDMP